MVPYKQVKNNQLLVYVEKEMNQYAFLVWEKGQGDENPKEAQSYMQQPSSNQRSSDLHEAQYKQKREEKGYRRVDS